MEELGKAREIVLVQAYSFTSAPIAKALVEAHQRGVRVEVLLDKSRKGNLKGLNDRRGAANSTLRPSKQVSGHRFDLRTETEQRLMTTPLRTNR